MAPFSHLSSHHSLSPLPLTTPPHHSPSPLPLTTPILLTLLTPFPIITSLHSPHPYSHQCTPPFTHYSSLLPLTTSSHHSPHYSLSLPLTTPHHPSSPTLLTTLFTTLFLTYLPNHTPLHHPLHPSPHHS